MRIRTDNFRRRMVYRYFKDKENFNTDPLTEAFLRHKFKKVLSFVLSDARKAGLG